MSRVLPLLNVTRRDILTCRTVSRGAKKVVDNLFQVFVEERESFQFTHEKSVRRRSFISEMHQLNNSYMYDISFWTGRTQRRTTAQQFLALVGESLGRDNNPFLTRSIMIPLNLEGDEYTALEQMLTRFGHHVWSLTACVNRVGNNGGEYIRNHRLIPTKKFARLLSLVPNLKSLTLSSGSSESIEDLSPEELPELKHLVSLNFKRWLKLNDGIKPVPFVFLLRYGRQLIELWDTSNYSLLQLDGLTVEVLNELLPNLKKLRLRRAYGSALPKLMNVNWRLEELTLACFYKWTTKHVFDIIMNFSQTLVQFQLNDDQDLLQRVFFLCGGIYGPPCKTLPNLQVLRLDVNFTDLNKQDWFWNWAPMMCGHIKEIHFDREFIQEHDYKPQTIEFHAAKHIFLKLPELERILFWQVTRTGRKLDILVRSDYALYFIVQAAGLFHNFRQTLIESYESPSDKPIRVFSVIGRVIRIAIHICWIYIFWRKRALLEIILIRLSQFNFGRNFSLKLKSYIMISIPLLLTGISASLLGTRLWSPTDCHNLLQINSLILLKDSNYDFSVSKESGNNSTSQKLLHCPWYSTGVQIALNFCLLQTVFVLCALSTFILILANESSDMVKHYVLLANHLSSGSEAFPNGRKREFPNSHQYHWIRMAEDLKSYLQNVNAFNSQLFLFWFCMAIPWMSYHSVESLPGLKGLAWNRHLYNWFVIILFCKVLLASAETQRHIEKFMDVGYKLASPNSNEDTFFLEYLTNNFDGQGIWGGNFFLFSYSLLGAVNVYLYFTFEIFVRLVIDFHHVISLFFRASATSWHIYSLLYNSIFSQTLRIPAAHQMKDKILEAIVYSICTYAKA
ncbi:unnamed protein product [Orchesella dallaii]|uniref:Uncharacterized protein n=1 Tax=Orchesella dallaii TaxID=48710 RepID=A0ABP1QGU4_9HEXA